MTTLLAWVGVDQRAPSSLYLAADSRITWAEGMTWDHGRKLFASRTQPDVNVIGYSGEVFFPTQALSQIVELIDGNLLFEPGTEPRDRLALIVAALERSAATYPPRVGREFDLLYGTREGQGLQSSFRVFQAHFSGGRADALSSIEIPRRSSVVAILGSGTDAFGEASRRWESSHIGGTSRAVFSALADSLKAAGDPYSGGPPQLVGLYRSGTGKTFGVVWNDQRFLCGMHVERMRGETTVPWHNDLFEICDPQSLARKKGAQPQPRPRGLA
jgi:hypothetical protein